jgi:hypothetical protein
MSSINYTLIGLAVASGASGAILTAAVIFFHHKTRRTVAEVLSKIGLKANPNPKANAAKPRSFSSATPQPKEHKASKKAATASLEVDTASRKDSKGALIGEKVRVFDETKHRNRMPGNQKVVPQGFKTVFIEEATTDSNVSPRLSQVSTEKLKGEFAHKFFGSQLMIGDRILVPGLPKKLHLLEITLQDQVFIDGVPQMINVGDLEELKRVIRSSGN